MNEVGIRLKVGATGIENIGTLRKELHGVGADTTLLDGKLAELDAELKRLANQQALIDQFRRQKAAVADAASAMDVAKANASALGREIAATEAPTRKQEAAFTRARQAARDADQAYDAQRFALQELRGQMNAAGVSTEGLAAAQQRVRADLLRAQEQLRGTAEWAQRLAAAEREAGAQGNLLASSAGRNAAALREQAAASQDATGKLSGVGTQLRNLAGIGVAGILGSQTAQLLKGVAQTADEFANLQARVKLVTGEGQAFAAAMSGIADVALRTNSNLEATGTLFGRLAQAGAEAGLSSQAAQQQALALTESINQAVQLSGASAEASNAAITQLIQGLQSGVLRGDEFNSVMEQAPRLAQALAAGLGVTTGQLRAMAEEGRLSSQTVIQALQSQRATLEKEFATLPATVGRAIENLQTKWTLFIGSLNESSGATSLVAGGINALAENLDGLAGVAERAGAVLLAALAVQGAGALRSLAVQMAATTGSAALLTTQLDKIPKIVNIAIAVTGFEVGFQVGEMLRENSALARQLGVGIAAFFQNIVSDLQLVAEASAAIFTSDTISGAFDRYRERGRELDRIFGELWEEAEQAPQKVGAAADQASAATQRLGSTAQTTGGQVAAAGAAGAAGLGATQRAADTARGAIEGLARAIGVSMPAATATAQQQADVLLQIVSAGGKAEKVLGTDLPAAIAKLSGPELEVFRSTVAAALTQATADAVRLGEELDAGNTKAAGAFARTQQAVGLLQKGIADVGVQAAQSLGVDVEAASSRMSAGFVASLDNLSVLIKSLPQLRDAGVNTAQVVSQALSGMISKAKTQAELDVVIDRVNALGAAGLMTGTQVQGAFEQINNKLRDLRTASEDATPGIQGIGEAARKAGVDVGQLTTGVREGFAKSVGNVHDLVTEMQKAGVEAERASPVLAEALDKRIQAAQTREELALVTAELERSRRASLLFGADAEKALEQVEKKARELSPALQQARKDAALLGVDLKDKTEQGIEAMIRAYERFKASGQGTTADVQRAFVNLGNKAIQAAGGVVPEWVKVEAGIRGVSIATDAAGNAIVTAMDRGGRSMESFRSKASAARQAVEDLAAAANEVPEFGPNVGSFSRELREKTNAGSKPTQTYNDGGFATNADGSVFTAGYQLQPPDGKGGWEFLSDARASGTGATVVPGVGYWRKTAQRNAEDAAAYEQQMLDSGATKLPSGGWKRAGSTYNGNAGWSMFPIAAPSPAPAPVPQKVSSTTHVVKLDLGSGSRRSVGMASAADADALVRALEDASRAAGR